MTRYRLDYPTGLGAAKWKLAYPRAFPALVEQEHARQPAARGARARDHARGERLRAAHRVVRQRHRPDADAGQDGEALRRTARRSRATTLLDPAKNVELGARLLGFLWKRFGGAPPLTIAGYNAGEGAVDRWLGERGDLDMDEFMETIPYDETRNYTKRVLASYFAYSWLYGDEAGARRSRCARAPRPQHAAHARRASSTREPKRRMRPRAQLPLPSLLLLLAPEEAAALGADALAAGGGVGAQVRLLLGA